VTRLHKRLCLALLVGLIGLVAPRAALAHDFSTSYSVLEVEGPVVRITLTLALADLHEGPDFDADGDGRVRKGEIALRGDLLHRTITGHFEVRAPDPPLTAVLADYEVSGEANLARMELVFGFDRDVTDLTVVSRLDRITQPDHRHLLQIGHQSEARFAVLGSDAPELTIDYAAGIPLWVTILEFIELGVEHIFTGYDHLAFLVGLLLLTTRLLSLVKIVTFFTIAHSVTLVLATLGVVTVPSRLIESLIALSIAWVAIENFTGKTLVHRRMVTFGFGLVHGFGFSNVLAGMGLDRSQLAVSLASFNVGVEIGQVLFVAVLFPILLLVGRHRWKEHVISAASVAIMCLGFYWFVQRAFVA